MTNRYLVRLSNKNHIITSKIESVIAVIEDTLIQDNVKTGNFRITNRAIEFDVFMDEDSDLIRKKLESSWDILSVRRITERGARGLGAAIEETRNLFLEERFWECHEVLESVWLKSSGEEKRTLQTLILVCAALVHFQRNQLEICLSMLQKYRSRLELDNRYQFGIDFKSLREEVDNILRTRNFVAFCL
ncbi:MAG: DUF309 domain-containing protein [Thaumarchaeota archaeon]|nr:DUF309 domain-containing protein [Nitrososphaerota archaeon]